EFWYTEIAYDSNPPADETKSHPLKEYLIKFSVMNGKKPLTIDFKTFTTSTGLDYNNGAYVVHPSPKDGNFGYLAGILRIQCPEASEAPSKKRKQPKPKKTPSETKVTPPKLTKGFEQSQSVSSGPRRDKESEGLKPPVDMKLQTNPVFHPSRTDAKYQADQTQSARLRYRSLTENKSKTSLKVEPHIEASQIKTFLNVQALLLYDDEMVQESDDEEVFATREDMDAGTEADEEVQFSPPNTDKPESSPNQDTNESTSDFSTDIKKYDNILPLTERQLVKYLRKVSRVLFHRLIEAQSIKSLDKNSIAMGDLLNAFNVVINTLKTIHDAVKEDRVLNKKVLEAAEAYTKNSTHLTELLTLIKNFDFQGLKLIEAQCEKHEKAAVSYADLRASIEGYYEENIDHMKQTDKVIDAAMKSLDKNSIAIDDLLYALNVVINTLKTIHDAVKEDRVLNKKVLEAAEAYTKNSTHLTELLTLIKNFDFQGLKSSMNLVKLLLSHKRIT
nr:hypothetical protein [Tanacetum cinerariifolium]